MDMRTVYLFTKRLFDITFSGIGIIISSPIWLISIIGIKLSDRGPIFYVAKRMGKDNKIFRMFKFRSMYVDNHANEKSLRPNQYRIYPFGKFMRATKIDELPQLLNVFVGTMSVVGPRPAAVDQVKITRGEKNKDVSSIKPGLTSPAALYDYLYGDSIEDEEEYNDKVLPTRLALDRLYLEKENIGYDLKLIWYTFQCILGTLTRKMPVSILEEMINAVDGDIQALDEVRK